MQAHKDHDLKEQNLSGKVVLVTGSARRIGAVIVRNFHDLGAVVVIHYNTSSDEAKEIQAELNAIRESSCFILQAELANANSMQAIIDEVIEYTGHLDVLVNNASSFYPTPVGEITEGDWENLMSSNLKGPLFLMQAAAPHLKETQGCIVNIIDIHAMRPMKSYPVYCAAKAGLLMLTQSMARELSPNVRVNGVAPGAILWPEHETNQTDHEKLINKIALKRCGEPDDIAKAVKFLVCDADYITGHTIPVDGGRLLNQ